MITYTLNDVLVIHSHNIIKCGVVSVFNESGILKKKFNIENKDFVSFFLPSQPGHYTIIINTEEEDKVLQANIIESKSSTNRINRRIAEIKENKCQR
ncbi:MAG: hypothetical protein HQ521_11420 [Bacteroidetes bacterium]|nr:hypothetical protein [Bacteroidota bacterium]